MPEEEQGTLNTGRSRQPLFDPLSFAFCIPTKPGALWQAIGDKEARMADTVGASGEYPGTRNGRGAAHLELIKPLPGRCDYQTRIAAMGAPAAVSWDAAVWRAPAVIMRFAAGGLGSVVAGFRLK